MLYSEKNLEIKDFEVIHDYGENETFFRLKTSEGEVRLPKLKFQLDEPLPETLCCRVKGYNGSTPIIGHNMPRYVSDFYADGFSRGEEFEFRVLAVPDDSNNIYRLTDDNGLIFKLHETKTNLTKGQSVKCRFEVLNQNMFKLQRSDSDALFPMLNLRDCARIAAMHGVNGQKIETFLRGLPEMAGALDELDHGRTSWVITAMKAVKLLASRLFRHAAVNYPYQMIFDVINGYRNVLLYLLQGSGFLRNVKGNQRIELQAEITYQLEQLDIYEDTLSIISNRGQNKFINNLLTNLKESGYIYHPTNQFSILMILFRMSPDLINSSLGRIFDTLMGWELNTWKNEPFRQAFVEQLEIYITESREDIDRFLRAETHEDNEMIEKVLTAIAIQQSLALPTDTVDMRVNLSLFYRYLSLLRSAKADVLLKKSYLTLLGVNLPTDFNWSDIKETAMMMTRAAVDPPANAKVPDNPRYYINGDIEVEVGPRGITIGKPFENADNQVANGMFPWPGLFVNVNLSRSISHSKLKSLEGHAEFWKNIENALFVAHDNTIEQVTRRKPDIGESVRIIIEDVKHSPEDYNRILAMYCRIVDDHYIEGVGYMPASELVNYNMYGVSAGTFRYDNGDYMVFEAKIIDIDDNDRYVFSLLDATHDIVRDLATAGDKCNCVVTKENKNSYSAISELGFGLYVKKYNDDLPYRPGNVLRVEITGFDNDAVQSVVEEGPIDIVFNNANALRRLLLAISIVDDSQDQEDLQLDEEDCLPREDLREIIEILRYKAVSINDNIIQSFDYLSYAHILALIINNEALAVEIKAHKDLLMLHQHYAKNKKIFREDIDRIVASAPNSTLVNRMATRLQIVASLGHPEDNGCLWDTVNNSSNETERELARNVLSYNLLYEINHDDDTAPAIKEKIARKLNVSSEQRSLKYYGSESQYVEFKSSLVYPAQKGKGGISLADPDKQEHEILHIIAGFMNAEGGILYIGVSDDHYECGLADDFNFYKLDSERNTKFRKSIKSLDNMANYLQNLIDSAYNLGKNAGEYAKTFIDDESKKGVIVVKIDACPHIVTLDGVIYVRHSAKTEPLLKEEEISLFRADREQRYKQAKAAASVNTTHETKAEIGEARADETSDVAVKVSGEELSVPEFLVATSMARSNILHDWDDPEHFVTPECYIMFVNDNDYIVMDNVWGGEEADSRLILTVKNDEVNEYLLLVYEGDYAVKVRMRDVLEKSHNVPHSHFAGRKLVFACPVKGNGGLYSLHSNSKQTLYERVTPIDKITLGSMASSPERIIEAETANTEFYEYVSPAKMPEFDSIISTSMKRAQIGALAKGYNVARTTVGEIRGILLESLRIQ